MNHLDDAEFTARHRSSKAPLWRKYPAAAAGMMVRQRSDLPNASFNPEATQAMTRQQVLVAPPREMAAVVFARHGIKHPKPKANEAEGR